MTTSIRPSTDTRARWRVALLGAHDEALATLKAAVVQTGGEVVIEAPPRIDSLALLTATDPNVVVLRPDRSGGRHPDLVPFTSAGQPVVLSTPDSSRAMSKLAVRAGVMAVLLEPLQPAQLATTLDLAVARFADSEILRRKLADRVVIERAKGRLMTLGPMTEEEAFRWLRTRAMDSRSRVADVARAVIDADGGGQHAPTDPGRQKLLRARFEPRQFDRPRAQPRAPLTRSHPRPAPARAGADAPRS